MSELELERLGPQLLLGRLQCSQQKRYRRSQNHCLIPFTAGNPKRRTIFFIADFRSYTCCLSIGTGLQRQGSIFVLGSTGNALNPAVRDWKSLDLHVAAAMRLLRECCVRHVFVGEMDEMLSGVALLLVLKGRTPAGTG